jgi:hypothetical protein
MMKELKDMTTNELVEFWTGHACIAIGKGEFRSAICDIILSSMQLGADNQKDYEERSKRERARELRKKRS